MEGNLLFLAFDMDAGKYWKPSPHLVSMPMIFSDVEVLPSEQPLTLMLMPLSFETITDSVPDCLVADKMEELVDAEVPLTRLADPEKFHTVLLLFYACYYNFSTNDDFP